MSLFEVEGWDLGTAKVKKGGIPKQKNKNKGKKEEKPYQRDDRSHGGRDGKDRKFQDKGDRKDKRHDGRRDDRDMNTRKGPRDSKDFGNRDSKDGKRKHDSDERSTKKPKVSDPELEKPFDAETEKPELVSTTTKLTPLQQKMMQKLSGSRFRWINEQLYTSTSVDALELIQKQPSLFDEYHQGFKNQVEGWPENPVDIFVRDIKEKTLKRRVNSPGGLPGINHTKEVVIADMGCGEAKLALEVSKFLKQNKRKNFEIKLHSFDLKKVNDRITVADIANVPLADESCSVAIFCLALMGTNFLDFIKEANRILIPRGELWISEIKSRFSDGKGEEFINAIKLCGFRHRTTDDSNKMFTRFEFFKPFDDNSARPKTKFINAESDLEKLEAKRGKAPEGQWLLKPCIYKRR
ncbi:unnamed protein product [Kuraishia capsulata CBS 1993]|uniref:Ribosomal RNA-processing protein 8 n=1 Tax=Kuraishia capsulata CBS 1993 TaxID=1382522 RepID=W6MNC8_9ASCO|nr:uncharacterized protein KUCA_T00004102001 [Kuraishia capsulata CBS 1993]CDK28121.1 unnamed protein product [Kuraishia capsulata CBS 1993]